MTSSPNPYWPYSHAECCDHNPGSLSDPHGCWDCQNTGHAHAPEFDTTPEIGYVAPMTTPDNEIYLQSIKALSSLAQRLADDNASLRDQLSVKAPSAEVNIDAFKDTPVKGEHNQYVLAKVGTGQVDRLRAALHDYAPESAGVYSVWELVEVAADRLIELNRKAGTRA